MFFLIAFFVLALVFGALAFTGILGGFLTMFAWIFFVLFTLLFLCVVDDVIARMIDRKKRPPST